MVHGDGKRSVLWTPEGFYDASPGADNLIGIHLNQGRNQAGEFVGSSQLAQRFYRPDLISRRLAGDVEIRYRVVDRGGGVAPIEIRLNGVVIQGRQNPTLRSGVKFAADDAKALVETLRERASLADAELGEVVLIPEAEATRARIHQELRAFARRVKPGDRFVLHLAGHGTAIDGEDYFLPIETSGTSQDAIRRDGLSGSQLQALLQEIPSTGGTLLLFDTCSSGTYNSSKHRDLVASVRRFERLDGRLMLAAAGDERMALESPDDQRGIFTGVVIEDGPGKG